MISYEGKRRLMRAAGLRGRHPRAWKKTTIAGQRPVDAPDLIGQNFSAAVANTRWCGDITYSAQLVVMCSSAASGRVLTCVGWV